MSGFVYARPQREKTHILKKHCDCFQTKAKSYHSQPHEMASNQHEDVTPVFCVRTTDKRTERTLYINYRASDEVLAPEIEIEEEKLVKEICEPSPEIEKYKIPLQLSPIYWSQVEDEGKRTAARKQVDRNYVIDVEMNKRFAFRQVISSKIIRHYVVTVTMVSIEEKYNLERGSKTDKSAYQYLGHKLELDQAGYEILKSPIEIKRSNEVVSNKIVLVDSGKELTYDGQQSTSEDSKDQIPYDLHLRPAMGLLTCSITTDRLPNSMSFNNDRLNIELADKRVCDISLPLDIDLKEPVKYKFDDRLSLLRIVLKMKEPQVIVE